MSVLTVANQLTLLRMMLIPAFVILVIYGHLGWALVVFAAACLTDALDGLTARWSGQKSDLGRVARSDGRQAARAEHVHRADGPRARPRESAADLADRAHHQPRRRDRATVAIVNLAIGPRTFRPSIFGKIATATYMMTAVVAMFFNYLGYHSLVVDVFVYASLAITLISSLHYIWHAARIIEGR